MAYKKNWKSKECTIEEGLSLLRMVAQEYTNHRYTVASSSQTMEANILP